MCVTDIQSIRIKLASPFHIFLEEILSKIGVVFLNIVNLLVAELKSLGLSVEVKEK